jgi:uncharacterized membrane protein
MNEIDDADSVGVGSTDGKLIHEMESDSDSLWLDQPILAIATLIGPVLVALAVVLSVALASGWGTARRLVLAAVATFFVLGRFVILGGTTADAATAAFSSQELALMVFCMDVMTAVVISWHAGILFRIPWLGVRLRVLMDTGQSVLLANRWMRRTTFASVVAFVMFPLASSGSIGGSLFGRLLGLSREMTLVGVIAGSLLGCATMYFGAEMINRVVSPDSVAIRWGGVVFIVIMIALLNRRYRNVKRNVRIEGIE